MIGEFRGSLYPWVIIQPEDDIKEVLRSFNRVRNALDDLIAMKITWNDYLSILDAEGVSIDEYLETAEQNLISVGF